MITNLPRAVSLARGVVAGVQPTPLALGPVAKTVLATPSSPLVVWGALIVSSPLDTTFKRAPSPLSEEHFAEGPRGRGSPERVSISECPLLCSPKVEVTFAGDEVAGAIAWAEEVVVGVLVAEVAMTSTVLGWDDEVVDEILVDFRSPTASTRQITGSRGFLLG